MAFDSWGLGSRSARRTVEGSRQYQPQERTSSAQLYRCWQTQAVSGHADTSNVSHVDLDNACCVSFGFDVTCESPMHTLLFVACPVFAQGVFPPIITSTTTCPCASSRIRTSRRTSGLRARKSIGNSELFMVVEESHSWSSYSNSHCPGSITRPARTCQVVSWVRFGTSARLTAMDL